MKMFTKIASAIATFMLILGLVCVGAAFAMGLTWGEFVDMVEEGKFSMFSIFPLFNRFLTAPKNLGFLYFFFFAVLPLVTAPRR